MEELIHAYKQLVNVHLPAKYSYPVCSNHCFNRIILDWLFCDCWYNHLSRNKTAISQLTPQQLRTSIERMNQWMQDQALLVTDNNNSLRWRGELGKKGK